MLLWLALGAALGYAGVRIFARLSAGRPGFRVLARREVAFLDAAADAMFPPGGPLPPSGSEARRLRQPRRLPRDRAAAHAPADAAALLLVEHATLAVPGARAARPPPLLVARRRRSAPAVLEGWRTQPLLPAPPRLHEPARAPHERLLRRSRRAPRTSGSRPSRSRRRSARPTCSTRRSGSRSARSATPRTTPPSDGTPLDPDGAAPPRLPGAAPVSAACARARGEVRVFAEYDRDVREEADVVVVGSGPCGAVVAKELADAGRSVVLLEEGPPFTPDDFELDGARSMARTMREGGLRATRGYVMPTMQAICLGGGSLVNSAICVRPPDFVFDALVRRASSSRAPPARTWRPHFDAVSAFLGIAPTPDERAGPAQPAVPRRLQRARHPLGADRAQRARLPRQRRVLHRLPEPRQAVDGHLVRARRDARRRARADLRPGAAGARRRAAASSASRATSSRPSAGRRSHRVRVDAKAVVLSAGCMATPVLLQKSGNLANRSGQVGQQPAVPSRHDGDRRLPRGGAARVRRDAGLPEPPLPARGLQARDASGRRRRPSRCACPAWASR